MCVYQILRMCLLNRYVQIQSTKYVHNAGFRLIERNVQCVDKKTHIICLYQTIVMLRLQMMTPFWYNMYSHRYIKHHITYIYNLWCRSNRWRLVRVTMLEIKMDGGEYKHIFFYPKHKQKGNEFFILSTSQSINSNKQNDI